MKPVILLRTASVLALLHGVLHTIGGVFGSAAPGPAQTAVTAMKSNSFVAMGVSRTYWDYFFGYGLFVTVSFLVEAVVFWQLGALAQRHPELTRPMVAAFCVAYLATAVVSGRYFFSAPMIMEFLIAACLGAALLATRETRASLHRL